MRFNSAFKGLMLFLTRISIVCIQLGAEVAAHYYV